MIKNGRASQQQRGRLLMNSENDRLKKENELLKKNIDEWKFAFDELKKETDHLRATISNISNIIQTGSLEKLLK